MCARNVGGNRAPSTPFPHPRRRRTRELPSRRPVNTPFPPHAEDSTPDKCDACLLPPLSSFLSFLFLRCEMTWDVTGTYPDGMDSSSPLYPILFSTYNTRSRFGRDGCAFSFSSFFFPPLFRTSQWRRASNNVWIILTLRCKLYFFRERERERGVFGGINNSLIWYLWDWNYKSETMESIIR